MRCYYNPIQQGQTQKANLTPDQIERLEEIGFKWTVQETLEQRCCDLEAFKSEFENCNFSLKYSADPSLGNLCFSVGYSYNQMQKGHTLKRFFAQEQIERLARRDWFEIGFAVIISKSVY